MIIYNMESKSSTQSGAFFTFTSQLLVQNAQILNFRIFYGQIIANLP